MSNKQISNELNDSGIESTITEDIDGFKFTSNVNLKEYDKTSFPDVMYLDELFEKNSYKKI